MTTAVSGGGTPTLDFMNTTPTPITRAAGAVVDFIPGVGHGNRLQHPAHATDGIIGGYAYFTNLDNRRRGFCHGHRQHGLVHRMPPFQLHGACRRRGGSSATSIYVSTSNFATTAAGVGLCIEADRCADPYPGRQH